MEILFDHHNMNNFQSFPIALFIVFVSLSLLDARTDKFILDSYYNPNRLAFKLSKDSFKCSFFGVVVPYYGNSACNFENFKRMSNLTIGFLQNNLNLGQLYDISIIDGYCVVSYGNVNFNEKIIMNGYGVVNQKAILDVDLLNRYLYLQNIAINSKSGLWNSFYNEMNCLKNDYL